MNVSVDVWLRGQDFATTKSIPGVLREPHAWTDDDVRAVLQGMLLAMHRLKHPNEMETPVALRGLSWIVNPYEEGGVLIAIEITMGVGPAGGVDRLDIRMIHGELEHQTVRIGEIERPAISVVGDHHHLDSGVLRPRANRFLLFGRDEHREVPEE